MQELLLQLKLLLQNRQHACARDGGRGYWQRVAHVGLQLLLKLGGQHKCLGASQSFDRGEKRGVHNLQRLIDWLSQLNSTGYWYWDWLRR
jgi:hypothetical protein